MKSPYRLIRMPLLVIALLLSLTAVSAQDDNRTAGCAMPEGWVAYTIQRGDTLSGIAARSGSSVEALQRANCLDNPRHIVAGQRLFVPRPSAPPVEPTFAERCRAAGYTPEECRRIYNALYGGNDTPTFAERCRAAGYTPEECRRIYNALYGGNDTPTFAERCRAAGYTPEECRRIYNANQGDAGQPADHERPNQYDRDRERGREQSPDDSGDNHRDGDGSREDDTPRERPGGRG